MNAIPPNGPLRPTMSAPRSDASQAAFRVVTPDLGRAPTVQDGAVTTSPRGPSAPESHFARSCREAAASNAGPTEAMNAAVVKRLETVYGSEVAMRIGPQVASLLRGDPMIAAAFQQVMSTSQSISTLREP